MRNVPLAVFFAATAPGAGPGPVQEPATKELKETLESLPAPVRETGACNRLRLITSAVVRRFACRWRADRT